MSATSWRISPLSSGLLSVALLAGSELAVLTFSEELVGADAGVDVVVDVVDEVDAGVDVLVFSALLVVLTVLLVFAGAEVSSLPQPVRLKTVAAQSAAAKILFFIALSFLSVFFGGSPHKYHYIYIYIQGVFPTNFSA